MPPMPLLKLTARLLGLVVDTIIGLAAVPMLALAIGALRVMPSVAEVEVNIGSSVAPEGIIEKILPSLEVRVISLAVMLPVIVRSPVSVVIETTPIIVEKAPIVSALCD